MVMCVPTHPHLVVMSKQLDEDLLLNILESDVHPIDLVVVVIMAYDAGQNIGRRKRSTKLRPLVSRSAHKAHPE